MPWASYVSLAYHWQLGSAEAIFWCRWSCSWPALSVNRATLKIPIDHQRRGKSHFTGVIAPGSSLGWYWALKVALNQKTRSMVWPCLAHSTPSDTCHDFSRVFKMGWDSYIGDSRNWDTLDHFCCVMNITPNDLDANLGSSHSRKPQMKLITQTSTEPHYIPTKSSLYPHKVAFLFSWVTIFVGSCLLFGFQKTPPCPRTRGD